MMALLYKSSTNGSELELGVQPWTLQVVIYRLDMSVDVSNPATANTELHVSADGV